MKIRNELAHARMDLERAIRGNCGVILYLYILYLKVLVHVVIEP